MKSKDARLAAAEAQTGSDAAAFVVITARLQQQQQQQQQHDRPAQARLRPARGDVGRIRTVDEDIQRPYSCPTGGARLSSRSGRPTRRLDWSIRPR